MKSIIILLLSLFPFIGNCKKAIEIPTNSKDSTFFKNIQLSLEKYNLDDLTISNDSLRIRMWMGNNIVELNVDEDISAKLTLSIQSNNSTDPIIESIFFDSSTARKLYDSLITKNIINIPGDAHFGIDGQYYKFEISTPDKYRLYSYWSPHRNNTKKKIVQILSNTTTILDIRTYQQNFYKSLDSGIYSVGMSSISKDKFLADSIAKSSLYTYIVKRMKDELSVNDDTDNFKFPMIHIDHRTSFLKDLNLLHYEQAKKITIIPANSPTITLYGTSGMYGIIIIETK